MSDFKQISPENKERLVGLVSKVADYVKQGYAPTEALTKAASDGNYQPDYILRAAEAYNGAAHLAHFKAAARDERGNSFPLADGHEAVNTIMNKVASKHQKIEFDALAYTKESNSYFDSAPDDSFLFIEKQAAAPSIDVLIKQAGVLENQENLNIANTRLAYNQACESLANSIHVFREKTASITEHRRTHWARELLERHGKQALDVISLATGITGEACTKLADQRIGYFSLGTEYLDGLDSIVRNYNQVSMLNEKLAQAEHDHYVNKVERENLLNIACGYKKAFNPLAAIKDVVETNPFLEPSAVPEEKKLQIRALEALADPKFFAQNKSIDKAMLMHELLKEDEIISKHPAKDINNALAEIYAIAPTAATYKPLMRAMLRKRLETGEQIDDFSLNQMINMDKNMRENTRELQIAPRLIGGFGDDDQKH